MNWLLPGGGPAADSGVGHLHERVELSHRPGGRAITLEALVDTGSTFTWLPRGVLEELGVEPEEERLFVFADGRAVRYPVAWIQIRLRGRIQPTIVVFGEPGSTPILGVVTLEEFLLAVDPVNLRLIPVPALR